MLGPRAALTPIIGFLGIEHFTRARDVFSLRSSICWSSVSDCSLRPLGRAAAGLSVAGHRVMAAVVDVVEQLSRPRVGAASTDNAQSEAHTEAGGD